MNLRPRPYTLPLRIRLVSALIRLPLFLGATVLCGTASLVASLFESDGRLQHRIAQSWARFSIWASGSQVTIDGADVFRNHPVGVYCSNHLSYMDTPIVFSSLPFQFRIVARSSLWTVPFIGWHLHRSGQIPVNVDNPRASVASLSGGVKTLKVGMPLFIFPEGGRSRDGHPSTFMNGPAFMAIRARVPLIPMALIGTFELLPIGATLFYPSPVIVAVGEPIATDAYTMRDVDLLTQVLRESILSLHYQHSYMEPLSEADEAAAVAQR